MKSKFIFPLFAFFTLLFMAIYFLVNPSYEKSIQAKYYYEIGEYKEAYELAKEAFSIDLYNRMASTIMAQSKTSLLYVAYIDDGKRYMTAINKIATNEIISSADKARMRLICEIMISSYVKLAPSIITDEKLITTAAKYNTMFEKLLEKVTK